MQMIRAALVLGVLAMTRLAFAEPALQRPTSQIALDHLEKAARLYDNREFEKAIEEYKAGNLAEPAAIFDYDLAQSYRQLHRYTEAIWHYRRFLKASPQTPARNAKVQELINQMQAELDQKAMTAPPTEAATAPTSTASSATPAPAVAPPPEPMRSTEQEPSGHDFVGFGLVGAGVVGLGVSTGLLISARNLHDQGNNTHDQAQSNALHDRADTRNLVGGVVGAVGVGLVAAGVIKLVLHTSASSGNATALGVGVSADTFYVFGSF
jgi:tetratricopeptide (TPR) repeat protein